MKLSELIAVVGDDHVLFQSLGSDTVSAQYSAKKGATITFATDPARADEMLRGESKYVGLVVWLPKERVPPEAFKRVVKP